MNSDLVSYLYVPGNRPDRFDKALASGVGAVIVDLEDAVPVADKAMARQAVADWLDAKKPVLLRINGVDSDWFEADLALCMHPGVHAVVLPKTEQADDLARMRDQTDEDLRIYPMIETARGLANINEICHSRGTAAVIFGALDFQFDLDITDENDGLLMARSQLVLASRLAGIAAPVDGVTESIDDAARISADAQRSRALGFGGKTCIHPRQVPLVHAAFAPSEDEVAWAQRVVRAAGAARGGAFAVDRKMVDKPVILLAQRILQRSVWSRDQQTSI